MTRHPAFIRILAALSLIWKQAGCAPPKGRVAPSPISAPAPSEPIPDRETHPSQKSEKGKEQKNLEELTNTIKNLQDQLYAKAQGGSDQKQESSGADDKETNHELVEVTVVPDSGEVGYDHPNTMFNQQQPYFNGGNVGPIYDYSDNTDSSTARLTKIVVIRTKKDMLEGELITQPSSRFSLMLGFGPVKVFNKNTRLNTWSCAGFPLNAEQCVALMESNQQTHFDSRTVRSDWDNAEIRIELAPASPPLLADTSIEIMLPAIELSGSEHGQDLIASAKIQLFSDISDTEPFVEYIARPEAPATDHLVMRPTENLASNRAERVRRISFLHHPNSADHHQELPRATLKNIVRTSPPAAASQYDTGKGTYGNLENIPQFNTLSMVNFAGLNYHNQKGACFIFEEKEKKHIIASLDLLAKDSSTVECAASSLYSDPPAYLKFLNETAAVQAKKDPLIVNSLEIPNIVNPDRTLCGLSHVSVQGSAGQKTAACSITNFELFADASEGTNADCKARCVEFPPSKENLFFRNYSASSSSSADTKVTDIGAPESTSFCTLTKVDLRAVYYERKWIWLNSCKIYLDKGKWKLESRYDTACEARCAIWEPPASSLP